MAYTSHSWQSGDVTDSARMLSWMREVEKGLVSSGQLFFNVKDYGAKGDGTTDDTTAIQTAATAAVGGTLVFPATTSFYKVTTSITIPANTVVTSGNWGGGFWNASNAIIKKTNGDTNGNAVFKIGANCQISNLSFAGPDQVYYLASQYPAGTNNPSYGCYGNTSGAVADGTRFYNCSFDYFKAAGIGGPFNVPTVDTCVFRSNLFGIDWNAADGTVHSCMFQHNVHSGFRTIANFNRLLDSRFEWNARYGAIFGDLTGSHIGGGNCTVVGNLFDRNGWAGLVLWNWHFAVTANMFTRNGAGGNGSLGITQTSPFDAATITPSTGRDSHGNLIYLAPATEQDKCHIVLNFAKYGVISGNHFLRGYDDGSGGSFSPKYVYSFTTMDHVLIASNQETIGWAGAATGDPAYGDGAGALYTADAPNFQHLRPPGILVLAYSASIATDAIQAGNFQISATNGTAYTITNPINAAPGLSITYDIVNVSGGVMGVITWGNKFFLAGAFVNPANNKRRTITFYYDGTSWVETGRAAADI